MTTLDRVYRDTLTLEKEMNIIAGDWNGKDDYFMSQGDRYHMEAAEIAKEVADNCRALLASIEGAMETLS